jgi:hypothetical protein
MHHGRSLARTWHRCVLEVEHGPGAHLVSRQTSDARLAAPASGGSADAHVHAAWGRNASCALRSRETSMVRCQGAMWRLRCDRRRVPRAGVRPRAMPRVPWSAVVLRLRAKVTALGAGTRPARRARSAPGRLTPWSGLLGAHTAGSRPPLRSRGRARRSRFPTRQRCDLPVARQ